MRNLVLVAALAAVGCASKQSINHGDSMDMAMAASPKMAEQREIIRTATQTIEVKDLKAADPVVQGTATKLGGFVEESSFSDEKAARYEVRVPSPALNQALAAMAALGKEQSRHVSAVDVTAQSTDMEAQLKNSLTMRDRLQKLMSKATAVKDILEIEVQLQRVQTEIDSLEARLKTLKNQVALSRISLTLERKTQLGPLGYVFYGISWAVQKLFVLN